MAPISKRVKPTLSEVKHRAQFDDFMNELSKFSNGIPLDTSSFCIFPELQVFISSDTASCVVREKFACFLDVTFAKIHSLPSDRRCLLSLMAFI